MIKKIKFFKIKDPIRVKKILYWSYNGMSEFDRLKETKGLIDEYSFLRKELLGIKYQISGDQFEISNSMIDLRQIKNSKERTKRWIMEDKFLDELVFFCTGYHINNKASNYFEEVEKEDPLLIKIKLFKKELTKRKKQMDRHQFIYAYSLISERENKYYALKIEEDLYRSWSEEELQERNNELRRNNPKLVTTDLDELDFKLFLLKVNAKYFNQEEVEKIEDELWLIHNDQYTQ